MVLYILRRVASAISVVVATIFASFAMFFLAPTDPAGVVCGPRCPPARYQDIRNSLNLDQPVLQQFFDYIKGLVIGRQMTIGGVKVDCSAPCLGYSTGSVAICTTP